MRHLLYWVAMVATALVACGGGESADTSPPPTEAPATTAPADTTTPPETTAPTETTRPVTDFDALDAEAQEIVETAIDNLAQRLGADPGDIRLVEFQYVTWNDGSLGCPQPGEMYTQALVDGSRTELELDGTTYDYHAGDDGDPFLCENPPAGPGDTSPDR